MRVRWEARDPAPIVAVLAPLRLATATLEIVASDDGADRLTLVEASGPIDPSPTSIALGIATVDTERYASERGWTLARLPPDPILGAFASAVSGRPWALLEPNTEGRLAAFLARNGEGPAAVYVAAPTGAGLGELRAALVGDGIAAGAIVEGPFGPQFTALGRSAWAPTLLICASQPPPRVPSPGD